MELNGKRVLITGGAKRLGREMAVYLSRKGCKITVHYRSSHQEAEQLRKEIGCDLVRADFTSASLHDLCKKIIETTGVPDILINNASSFTRSAWNEVTEELWDDEISVNLKAPFFLSSQFGKRMKENGSGKIINMADIAAERPYQSYLPYSIAKAGVIAATRAFARILAPEVQVNAIAPGTILPPESQSKESSQKLISKIPAGRSGTVEELLRTVDFLLSDVDYITGQTILLDGGRSLTW